LIGFPERMIHNFSPNFKLFYEVLLNCADGHCLFDSNGKLLSWSFSCGDFYPKIKDRIKPGYECRQFMRDLLENQALKNFKPVQNAEEWVEKQLVQLNENAEFIHHLEDGRFMHVRCAKLSNGYWLFVAQDITASYVQREALEESVRRMEGFSRISADWFWELDSELRYVYFSSQTSPVGGVNRDDLIGKPRLEHMLENAELNSQCREHNAALMAQEEVESVITWDDGELKKHIQMIAAPKFNSDGEFTGYVGCSRDITIEYSLSQQLEFQANHDELTGLINRRAFGYCLNSSLETRAECELLRESCDGLHQTLIFVDLDLFKMVNDNAGHQAGDQLLKDVTKLFKSIYTDPKDIIARLGGDEFAVLSVSNADQAKEQAEAFISCVSEYQFLWDKRTFSIGASAGIVRLDYTSDASDLLSRADAACYSAKMGGRNQVHLYSSDGAFVSSQNDEVGKLELINDALLNERLSLHLQPIVPASGVETIHRFEVLLRLGNGDLISPDELVAPGEVIPVAEKYDRMPLLDMWVVEKAIESLEKFRSVGEPVALSVNLSGTTLSNQACLERITSLVDEYSIEPDSLCFEISETAAIKGIEKAYGFIDQLRRRNCQFSLDDFGSGLSSFSYLRSLNVDYLKIDGCFISNIIEDSSSRAMVVAFNTLAHELGMKTVAEHVENDAIAALLKELNTDYLQGFGIGRPQDIDQWLNFYTEQHKLTGS